MLRSAHEPRIDKIQTKDQSDPNQGSLYEKLTTKQQVKPQRPNDSSSIAITVDTILWGPEQ